ncbi:MAG TPA: class I SAM-dependent methyltransferase [Steroidobacteraceae bacterium]
MSAVFDAAASTYDEYFTATTIGALMRRAVWRRCDLCFPAGCRVLEMNCGTGEDAVHLARRGVRVLATDAAAAMIKIAAAKVAREGVGDRVRFAHLAWEDLHQLEEGPFDGVLSNFGGLNCVASIDALREPLARRLRPGARALLCVMGPLVLWEWLWYLLRKEPRKAFRRLARGGASWSRLRIRYPSIRSLCRALAPEFRATRVSAIGALVPPPYTESWSARHPKMLSALDRIERRLEAVPPLPWLADHYLLELERMPPRAWERR